MQNSLKTVLVSKSEKVAQKALHFHKQGYILHIVNGGKPPWHRFDFSIYLNVFFIFSPFKSVWGHSNVFNFYGKFLHLIYTADTFLMFNYFIRCIVPWSAQNCYVYNQIKDYRRLLFGKLSCSENTDVPISNSTIIRNIRSETSEKE